MSSPKQKSCARCGQTFGCGVNNTEGGCWCASFPVLRQPNWQLDCFCPECLTLLIDEDNSRDITSSLGRSTSKESSWDKLVEGEDYYVEGEHIVFTALYHLRRGYCCESGCRHCPYGFALSGAKTG